MSQIYKRLKKAKEAGEARRMVVEMERGRRTIGEVLIRRSGAEIRKERLTRELKRGKSPVMEARERILKK